MYSNFVDFHQIKFLFALTFVIQILFMPLFTAIVVSLIWGMSILTILSYIIARSQGEPPWKVVGEHILITLLLSVLPISLAIE
jgi:VIT1/CCC1 family predicted Fe2+/Mn2+ transporter